jgi:hypothetical protein
MTNAVNLSALGSNGGTSVSTWTTGTRPASPLTGQTGYNTTLSTLEVYNGSAWAQVTNSTPQTTIYTSGSGTYTVPTNAKWLQVEVVGGGGGGGGSGTGGSGSNGNTGGTTTFGSSFLTAVGGGGGASSSGASGQSGGSGGSATFTSGTAIASAGSSGTSKSFYNSPSAFSGGGVGGVSSLGAGIGGGGDGGFSSATSVVLGAGGGGGGYVRAYITSPSSSYAYAVGAGGTAGTAGTSGFAGAAGAAGIVIITAYFG